MSHPDVVVVGAGVVGAACAYACSLAGLRVTVVDRGPVAGGTSGAGEGNLLVSDKPPGPELALMLHSLRLWSSLDIGPIELEPKGGIMVASTPEGMESLRSLAVHHRGVGVEAEEISPDGLPSYEPHIARDLAGGMAYSQDTQVQPMLATARLLAAACGLGAVVRTGVEVTGIRSGPAGSMAGVQTSDGLLAAGAVVNAAGTWGGELSTCFGAPIPVLPRRGFVLVTEPFPDGPPIRHKVYVAEYLANVASSEAGLETSGVVESTPSGTVLIGASRERVGFDRSLSIAVLARLARQAIRLFPFLEGASVIRTYRGFRPYCPDHLPVIGPDDRVPGVYHACGHEGAGIGLSMATGDLIAAFLTGATPAVDPTPFAPSRFAEDGAA